VCNPFYSFKNEILLFYGPFPRADDLHIVKCHLYFFRTEQWNFKGSIPGIYRGVAQHYIDKLSEFQKEWRKQIKPDEAKGYTPPAREIYLAALCANLYELTGKEQYLQSAKKLLVKFADHKKLYPKDFYKTKAEYADGLPALANMFYFGKYVHAYVKQKIKPSNKI